MKKRYKLESGMDTSITLEIDTDKIPESMAGEINAFWTGADDVLDMSDGDVYQAVARRAAGPMLGYLLEDYNQRGAAEMLLDNEGWPGSKHGGITIIDHEIPLLGSLDFDVAAIAT